MKQDRRQLLKLAGAGALAAAFPESIQRALAVPAHRRTGSIKDVEHVVFLMQENRSFDHYFGSMRGVRGFGDKHPARLTTGKSVWHFSAGNTICGEPAFAYGRLFFHSRDGCVPMRTWCLQSTAGQSSDRPEDAGAIQLTISLPFMPALACEPTEQ